MTIYNSKSNNDFNFIDSDTMPTGCSGQRPSMTGGNNTSSMTEGRKFYMNMTDGNDNLKMTQGKDDACVSIPCHSRAMTRESSRKMNHCFSGYSCQSTNMTRIISQSAHTPSLSPLDSVSPTLSPSGGVKQRPEGPEIRISVLLNIRVKTRI